MVIETKAFVLGRHIEAASSGCCGRAMGSICLTVCQRNVDIIAALHICEEIDGCALTTSTQLLYFTNISVLRLMCLALRSL